MKLDYVFLRRYLYSVIFFSILGIFDSFNFAKEWYFNGIYGTLIPTIYLVFILFNVYVLFHLLLFGHPFLHLFLPLYFVLFIPFYIGLSGFIPLDIQKIFGVILSCIEGLFAITILIRPHVKR